MDTQVSIFPASLDSLEPIRGFIAQKCTSIGLNRKKAYGLCLAIDEIATNIINYGYPKAGVNNGSIKVILNDDGKQLTVTLADKAVAFNPLEHLVPSEEDMSKPLEERPIGGLGILLAQQNVDEFNYEYKDNANHNIFIVNTAS